MVVSVLLRSKPKSSPNCRAKYPIVKLSDRWLYVAVFALMVPALFINLGLLAFIDDEAIRSLVALEMKLSGNYIAPTLNGVFYYNKPPLYNWILLAFFEITGRINEWTARIPTVLCLLGYAATIYYFFRKHYDRHFAFLNALVLVTCGRILFWDSMLGLIDICFSWITFSAFMVIYHQFQKGQWYRMFLWSYLLTAAGFMMKGLPAVVFQGTTLFVYFVYRGQFKRLFSWAHVLGGLAALMIVGSYYLVYDHYNSLENVFSTLFTESSKRTVVRFGIWNTIVHFFTFPFEMIYHFLPWSVLIVHFIKKGVLKEIRQDAFITFNLLVFLSNILIYWTSPEVYPRYLLMLAPPLFSVFIYLHFLHKAQRSWTYIAVDRFYLLMCIIATLLWLMPLYLKQTQAVPGLYFKTTFLVIGLAFLTWLYQKQRERRLMILGIFLLLFRIGFDWFILPDRNVNDYGNVCREDSKRIGRQYATQPLFVLGETELQTTNAFYITNERGAIVPFVADTSYQKGAYYIIDPVKYRKHLPYQEVDSLRLRHGKLTFDIGKF